MSQTWDIHAVLRPPAADDWQGKLDVSKWCDAMRLAGVTGLTPEARRRGSPGWAVAGRMSVSGRWGHRRCCGQERVILWFKRDSQSPRWLLFISLESYKESGYNPEGQRGNWLVQWGHQRLGATGQEVVFSGQLGRLHSQTGLVSSQLHQTTSQLPSQI